MSAHPIFQAIRRAFCVCLCMLSSTLSSIAQDPGEPRVARVQLQLKSGDDVIDVIEQGDLLTVLGEQEQGYTVLTYQGRRGQVDKANTVELAESVQIYDQLVRATPQEGRLYTQRAMAWWARGDQKRALADFDRAIQLGYKASHAYTSRGTFQAAVGHIDEAIEDFGRAITIDPSDEVPYINRAGVFMTQDKTDLALKDYDAAVRLNPKKAGNYQQRAGAHKMKGNFDAAIADFNKALELDPKHVPALLGRGYVLYSQKRYSDAVADYSAAITLAPKSATAYNNRGFNRQLLGDEKDALGDYEQALKLAPDYALCYQNKAWLLATSSDASLRNGAAAVQAALRACELNQYKELGDLRALAASYAEAGQFELAIGWQEKVVELSPADEKQAEQKILEQYKNKHPYRESLGQVECPS